MKRRALFIAALAVLLAPAASAQEGGHWLPRTDSRVRRDQAHGPDYLDLFRRAADQVDQILRGVKPSDMPVEQPTKFELVLNQKTAKALGIAASETMLGDCRRGD